MDRIQIMTAVTKLAQQLTTLQRATNGESGPLGALSKAFGDCHAALVNEELIARQQEENLNLRAEIDADLKTALLDVASDCFNEKRTN